MKSIIREIGGLLWGLILLVGVLFLVGTIMGIIVEIFRTGLGGTFE